MHASLSFQQDRFPYHELFLSEHKEHDQFIPYEAGMAHKLLHSNNQLRVRTELSQSVDCHPAKKKKSLKEKRWQTQQRHENQICNKEALVIKTNNLLFPSLIDSKRVLQDQNKHNADIVGKQKNRLEFVIKCRKYSLLNGVKSDESQALKPVRFQNLGLIKNSNVFLYHHEQKTNSFSKNSIISRRELKKFIQVTNVGSSKPVPLCKNLLHRSYDTNIKH